MPQDSPFHQPSRNEPHEWGCPERFPTRFVNFPITPKRPPRRATAHASRCSKFSKLSQNPLSKRIPIRAAVFMFSMQIPSPFQPFKSAKRHSNYSCRFPPSTPLPLFFPPALRPLWLKSFLFSSCIPFPPFLRPALSVRCPFQNCPSRPSCLFPSRAPSFSCARSGFHTFQCRFPLSEIVIIV